MKYAIDETELARLEELAGKASKGPFFEDGFDVQDDDDNEVACCNRSDDLSEDVQEANTHYIAAACNAVPALVAEVRRLRAEAKQGGIDYCALMDRHDAQFVRAEDLKKQVEDLQWFVECFDNCKQRGKLPLEVHKTPSAYSEAWASLWAAREAVHADRE